MSGLAGTGTLLRFHLRRDRLLLLCWIVGAVLLYYTQAVGTDGLYATQADLDKAAAGMQSNAAFIAMAGPPRALDTVGGQVAWQASAFGAIVAGLMSMFLVGRHTRAEEKTGRDELVRAAAIGRHAPLAAASLVVLTADATLGVLVAASLISYGLPLAGSVALGLAAGLAGLVFGAVALVAAQLAESTRAAYGITGAVLGLAYVLRAVGDIGNGALSWLSPIGWGQYMRAYAGETWWPALLSVAAVAMLGVAAAGLFDRRDIGSGVLPARAGPNRGRLGTTFALAWRLQRGSVIGWTCGLALMGLAFGSVGDDVGDVVGDSQFAQDVFGQGAGSIVSSFYATLTLMLALIGSGFAIASVLRLSGEERSHHAELVLSTAEPRWRWAASQLAMTVLGTVAVVVVAGLGLGLGLALATGDSSVVFRMLGAAVPYLAPMLLLAAVTFLAYGVHPGWGSVGWVALGFCVVVMLFGDSLRLPGWLADVSPFKQVAHLPAEDLELTPLLVLIVLVVAISASAMAALRDRDIT